MKWLLAVIGGSAMGKDWSPEDVEMKAMVLKIAVEDRDVRWFTTETIREAWKTFDKWIPAAAELMDFFDTLEANELMMAQRMLAVSDVAARGPKPKERVEGEYYNPTQEPGWTWSRERAERYAHAMRWKKRAELAALAKVAREQPGAQHDHEVPERGPGESDELFMMRLKQHRDRVLDAATKVMNSPDAGRSRLKPDEPRQVATCIRGPRVDATRRDIEERARREAARHDGKPSTWGKGHEGDKGADCAGREADDPEGMAPLQGGTVQGGGQRPQPRGAEVGGAPGVGVVHPAGPRVRDPGRAP